MTDSVPTFDAAVVGGGPAGLSAAVALAGAGARVALVAPPAPAGDWRTAALFGSSVDFLDRLGLVNEVAAKAAALRTMRLTDITGRLIRAPEVVLHAREIGRDLFGYNIANRDLVEVFTRALAGAGDRIVPYETLLGGIDFSTPVPTLALDDGRSLSASLVVGADGRKSRVRTAAGITVRSWTYPQTALVLNLEHTGAHHDTSTEFHTRTGPFTLVPLGPGRSSLVCVERPEVVQRLVELADDALAVELERRCRSLLGGFTVISPRQSWPMSAFKADRLVERRVVLVGEAAHGFPPLGAQGLNLTLRDVADLATVVGEALGRGQDPGDREAVARYARLRTGDVAGRVFGVDLLNRSLLSDALPIQFARAVALGLAHNLPQVRKMMLTEGMRA